MIKFSQNKSDISSKKQQLFALGYSRDEIEQILFTAHYLDAFSLFGEFFDFRSAK